MATGIYKVSTDGADDRFVEAASNVDAFVHVASDYFKVDLLSNAELRAAVKAGVSVETTAKVKAAAEKAVAANKAAADAAAARVGAAEAGDGQ